MYTELQQHVINTTFNGDADAYERAWSRTSKDTLQWSTIIETSTISYELQELAINLMKFHFGFQPSTAQTTPYIPVISSLITDYQNQLLSYDQLIKMSHDCLLPVRNHIVVLHSDIAYPQSTYREYSYLPFGYKNRAKSRFKNFLGYEPKTETSIQCELAISSVLSNDGEKFDSNLTEIDCHLLTIIKYREVLLTKGKQQADTSPLPIQDIYKYNSILKSFIL